MGILGEMRDSGVLNARIAVHVVCAWLDALVLGIFIPLLLPLSVLTTKVHLELAFGHFQLLVTKDLRTMQKGVYSCEPPGQLECPKSPK
eukprot:599441-Amphidinium_carterae.1